MISVDTKKKELVGDFKNAGREWQPKGTPEEVLVHDFTGEQSARRSPTASMTCARRGVGERRDRPRHRRVRRRLDPRWWRHGAERYPDATSCSSPPTAAAATATARACGRSSCSAGRRARAADPRLPLPAGDQQVEQDRASPILVHHRELAREAAPLPPGRRHAHRRDHRPRV